MSLAEEKCVALTTFRRDGTPVSTPVWIVALDDGRLGLYTSSFTGKAKRLRHTTRVTLQPSNARGEVKSGTVPVPATAELVDGPQRDRIMSLVKQKYGLQYAMISRVVPLVNRLKGRKIAYGDVGIVITLATEDAHAGPAEPQ